MKIRPIADDAEAAECAGLMCSSDRWITLGSSYDESLAIVKDPAKEVYVASGEGTLAGFLIINMRGAFIGYIQTVCVAPAERGVGVGTSLVRFAEDRILGETPNVFICASSFNPRARQLYERLGYQVVGELKDYLVAGHSEILLRKSVGPLSEFARP
jgi:ribosomal-protein-alanine N-acetyltransferase